MSLGSISSMNIVLKFNRSMLPQRNRFNRKFDGIYSQNRTEYNLPLAASPDLLWKIRTTMKEENRIRNQKVIITFSIVMLSLITCLLYLNSNYHQILEMF